MTVSPIHHGRDGETAGEWGGCGGDWGHWGYGIGVAGRWGSLSGMRRRGLGEDLNAVLRGLGACRGGLINKLINKSVPFFNRPLFSFFEAELNKSR
ncbi:hypothetical protein DOZ69_20150 [Pseudomonas fluorescens]|nr:hypothetical protein DOZ69_20150 [Pseudomonas fluorescens]